MADKPAIGAGKLRNVFSEYYGQLIYGSEPT